LKFDLELYWFSPKSSGTGGGNTLTISGKRLGGNSVFIDGVECQKITSNSTIITCVIPPSVSGHFTTALAIKVFFYENLRKLA
jgi:hypothetical protein